MVTGAAALGVDFLFLTAGIHAGEIGVEAKSNPQMLTLFFEENRMPKAVMHRLVW